MCFQAGNREFIYLLTLLLTYLLLHARVGSFGVRHAPQLHLASNPPVSSLAAILVRCAPCGMHTCGLSPGAPSLAARAQRPHSLPPLHRRFAAAPLRVGSCLKPYMAAHDSCRPLRVTSFYALGAPRDDPAPWLLVRRRALAAAAARGGPLGGPHAARAAG